MCALSDLGIGSSDFLNNELADFGTSITIYRKTGTIDFRGAENVGYGTGTSLTVVFHVRNKTVERTKHGLVQLAPAYIMARQDSNINRGDKIETQAGSVWRVFDPVNREDIHTYSDCYAWDD